ncbi:MAG TPA: HEAT repeat domain-containing protein [Kiritimatiellia bacterium]|nr:HEAT repeat domain-containing protein [Kiritimatiellia bacterium]HRU70558.1 HEAT repeat domain-containing protein [Kiritimatiellia bacterium]
MEKPKAVFGNTTVPVTLSNGDITFFCPHCSCKLIVTERAAGKQIPCRKCNVPVIVPGKVIPPDPIGRETVNLTFRQEAQASLSDLVKRVREGDATAARAILAFGANAVPAVVEGLENSFDEPKENRAADYLADVLVKIGAASVKPLISKLGKSRRAYYALGRIGTEEALDALIRELTSVNWRRVEAACIGLGLTENPNAAYVLAHLENTRKTTRVGEVFTAAGSTITALQRRLATRM